MIIVFTNHIRYIIFLSSLAYGVHTSLPQSVTLYAVEIQSSVEGDTQKLQNRYPQGCLPWATRIIAPLGGLSRYLSQRPPGMPTLVQHLRQFESIFLGWKLAQGGLVYTR
ncbi:hypothetical protein [Nostoc sp.]|uniref:hypothetical protein n=1 Tax=Nostoc sp. TaxID=1180 RepID=UPI002FFC98C0